MSPNPPFPPPCPMMDGLGGHQAKCCHKRFALLYALPCFAPLPAPGCNQLQGLRSRRLVGERLTFIWTKKVNSCVKQTLTTGCTLNAYPQQAFPQATFHIMYAETPNSYDLPDGLHICTGTCIGGVGREGGWVGLGVRRGRGRGRESLLALQSRQI